jgi:tetratricopeptide (TPR) repeat protein
MPQHYLPATFLASFSLDLETPRRRNRRLYVGDKREDRVFRTRAENVAAINDFYTLVTAELESDVGPGMVDSVWTQYERDLSEAITLLINGGVDARTWIRVLVPFVACMLVRGPDFNTRFEGRMDNLGLNAESGLLSRNNTNFGRVFELQRLLGPVAVAKWRVIRTTGAGQLITNDLGYAPFDDPQAREFGIAIPLDPAHILAVIPRDEGQVAVVRSGKWIPDIEYAETLPTNHDGLSRALWATAQRFVFGPDEETVKRWLRESSAAYVPAEPEQLGFLSRSAARAHEFTWHRLAAALERDPSDTAPWDFPLDWEKLSEGWAPPVFFPANLVEFPPALRREGDSIIAEFYDPEGYYVLSVVRQFEEIGDYRSVVEEATRGLDLAHDNALRIEFLVTRAGALDELERYDEALSDYNEFLEIEPRSAIALTNRAATFLKIEEFAEAERDLEQALSLDPDQEVARLNLGNLHNMRGDFVSAVRELTRALRSSSKDTERGTAHLSRGNAHLELENHREAIEDFSIAAKLITDPEQKAYCEFQRAVALSSNGDHTSASQAIEASLELNDESFEAHVFKGKLGLEQGKPDDAIAEFTRSLELGATDGATSQVLNLRAEAYANEGRFDLALRDRDRVIELDPGSSAAYYNRGNTLLLSGKADAAVEAFSRAVELDKRNAGALNNRGIAHALQGAFGLAMEDHKEAVLIFDGSEASGSPLRNLALCYSVMGDVRSAIKAVGRAKELDAESPYNDQVDGLVRLYEGKFADSLTLMSRVASKNDDVSELKLYVSLPLAFLGELDEAQSVLEECLGNLEMPITKMRYLVHLRALREAYPEEEGFATFSRGIDPT